MAFATEEINETPHLLPNVTLGFKMYDSCFSEASAIEGVLWMLSGKQKPVPNYSCQSYPYLACIIGDDQSSSSIPMARIMGLYRYPQISYGSAVALLSDKIQFPSFLRTMPSDSYHYVVMSNLIIHFGWTWIGIVASDNDYGILGSQNVKKEIIKRGGCVAFIEILSLSNAAQKVQSITEVIKQATVNVIVVYSTKMEVVPLMIEAARKNITGKVWIATIAWMISPVFSMKELEQTLHGTFGLAPHKGDIPGFTQFIYNLHPSKFPKDIFIKEFWETAYGCSWLNQDKAQHSTNTSKKILFCTGEENLEEFHFSIFDMFDYRYAYNTYDAIYAVAYALHNMFYCQYSNQQFYNKTCSSIDGFKHWQLLYHLQNVHFKNKAGEEVFFDMHGDPPAIYDILNWQLHPNGSSMYVSVGTANSRAPQGQEIKMNESIILWNGENKQVPQSTCSTHCLPGFRKVPHHGQPICCFDCSPCSIGEISNQSDANGCFRCPETQWPSEDQDWCIPKSIEFLSFEEPLGMTLAVSAVFCSLVNISILCVFVKFNTTPIVKANNWKLSYLLLLCLTAGCLCSLVFIGKPQTINCMLRQTAFGIIFSTCVSCILAKTVTVVIAFRASNPHSSLKNWVGPTMPTFIVIVCPLLQVVLCVIWLTTFPPLPYLNIKSENAKMICECTEGSAIFFYSMLGYMGLLASVSLVVAFLGRKLPDSFNEAKFITFSMIVFISVWFSFIPAYLSTRGRYTVAVEIFAILSSSAGMMFCIFFPKCYIILLRPSLNTREHLMSKTKSFSQKF
ncbi:extracellular calcium-sensing receptor-like [Protopterus annectens]|uniref:extracellular calcium-sensing receptor-like n=1 Tax=Protopterus annectens TaxID=7888 RepID=UPI001CF96911|nr:extracellular calcium-sensing receptor-like [Protopterus annectens]